MIKLMLADDHAIMRGGLKDLLSRASDFILICEACDGTELLEILQQRVNADDLPDILLTDLSMPGVGGIDLIERIRKLCPKLPILVLTMFNDALMASRIIKAGADGYLTKDSSPEQLIAAVRKVAEGGKSIDPKLAEKILFQRATVDEPHNKLSAREFDVMRLILKGQSVNAIAEYLCISNKTVSTHKTTMLRKMGMTSTPELVRYAMAHGLFREDT
ncbi:MAG: response regulator transcription factor [Gallionellaceae bacterium]